VSTINFSAFTDEFMKIAQDLNPEGTPDLIAEAPKPAPPHPALLVGAGLAGLGTGYIGGHLATHGLNKLLKNHGGLPSGVLKAAPAVAGLTGLAVGAHQAYTWDKVRKAMEAREAMESNASQNS